MTKFVGLYDVRDLTKEDHNFIYATFLRGLYYGDSWFSLIPKAIFMENYKKVVEALLAKSIVKVACLKEDPGVIIGYSMLSSDFMTIHYVFVKAAWRNKGIGRSLCPQRPEAVTHLTALGRILMSKIPTAIFNPFFKGV